MSIDVGKYLNKLNDNACRKNPPEQLVHCECLHKAAENLFYNEKVEISNEENEKLLERILNENDVLNFASKEEEWEVCVNTLKRLFENNGDHRAYIRDIETAPEESPSVLGDIESLISIGGRRNFPVLRGINTPMHYVGEKGSFTAHHEEDGGLSSINVLKSGEPKLWFVIDYKWQAEVEKNVADYLREKTPDENICSQVLKHKIYLISPSLLDQWHIPYTIVSQKAGDLFFIRSGTYHAVVNMGRNIAEVINYGCVEWNCRYEPIPCNCDENNKNEVEQDRTVVVTHKRLKKQLYECSEENCNELFVTKKKMDTHTRMIHRKNYKCPTCSEVFNLKCNFTRHIKQHLPDRQKTACSTCGRKVLCLSDHERKFHGEKQQCNKCNKMIAKHQMSSHEKTCHIRCSLCSKICTNQRYLTMHIKRKHNK